MMAKPICVIYFPQNYGVNSRGNFVGNIMNMLNGFSTTVSDATDYWKQYYWFCFIKTDINEPELQVFHEKDFTDIQFNELRELVMKSIEEQKAIT